MSKKQKSVEKLEIIKTELFHNGHLFIDLKLPEDHPEIKPGQFVEVKVENKAEVFLRRPLSVHDYNKDSKVLSLWVKIVGKGTHALSELKEGDFLDLIYPLGKGFSLAKTENVLLVGGGCGAAPLLCLARYLSLNDIKPKILLGTSSKNEIFHKEKYEEFGELHFTTVDGSYGEKGFVTHSKLLGEHITDFSQIYVCGPDPMMKAVSKLAMKHNIPCEISLENTMACGIGACLCCVVKTDKGHVCTCTEGPVFSIYELNEWINE